MCMEMQENIPYVITCIGFYYIEIYLSTSFYAVFRSTNFFNEERGGFRLPGNNFLLYT